ncbi:serine/threonine-protein kinase par-1-like isoform X2 [Venturia canescens]|uniref:serine/threonine-protein kinase par-1-like isoform X2 n=1 Tax=Venturia canescens TaxID=32260 RepID=UPI001C9C2ECA|nr:serine/threonine-protein kinase par-1-like isoform X2 [Venturia canescens]
MRFNQRLAEINLACLRGKFGTVYHCKEKTSGLMLAAKVVTTTRKEDRRSVEREVEIMRRLQHPRLIQLYDAIDTGKQIYVILELIQGGELFERVIDEDFVLTERSCAVFMRQICEGIEFVHAQHILHLDMKPENILCLTKEGNRIKIIDFGLARQYDPRKKMQVLFGTPEFVAPEVVNFDQIGFGTDMWSIGVICYVLLSGLSPFMGDTDVETMANVTIAKYDFDHDAFADISEDAKDFIRCLLVKDKEKRSTAATCRQHRWLLPQTTLPKQSKEAKSKGSLGTKPKTQQIDSKPKETVPSRSVDSSTLKPTTWKQELDVTKDNLRLFVERWREHPNSPYSFEADAIVRDNLPTGSEDKQNPTERTDNGNLESMSLRGQSPSPCGSVCSTSSGLSSSQNLEESNSTLAVPSTLVWGLERRASEGNFAASGHRRDQAAQIVLAEEIIKLSEHLRNLAMVRPGEQVQGVDPAAPRQPKEPLAKGGRSKEKAQESTEKKAAVASSKLNEANAEDWNKPKSTLGSVTNSGPNEISEKLSNITRQRKIKGTTFNGSRSYESTNNSVAGFSLKKGFSRGRKSEENETPETGSSYDNIISKETLTNEGRVSKDNRPRVTWKLDNEEDRPLGDSDRISYAEASKNDKNWSNREMDLTPPWRRSRTIRRFGETCRDVPRISNLRDIHKNLNLDEPTSTKDLLLQLLGELDDTSRAGGIGRKSISVDWCGEESVARRSMNSLAKYFQSEQQKIPSSAPLATSPASTSSIHR